MVQLDVACTELGTSPIPTATRIGAWLHHRWHLVVAAVVSLAMRVPGMFNGLPYVLNPDEPVNYSIIHTMVVRHAVLPHEYTYPSLQYEMQGVVHAMVLAANTVTGAHAGSVGFGLAPGGHLGTTLVQSRAAWLAARGVVVVISTIGVVVAAHIAARFCASKRVGLAAGVLAATSGIGVASGFTITPDGLAGTMSILTLACLVPLFLDSTDTTGRTWVITTGVCLGAATGSKYNAALLVLPVVLAAVLAPRRVRPTATQLLAVAAISLVAFTLTTPAVLFDTRAMFRDISGVLHHYSTGHPGAEGNSLGSNLRALWASDGLAVVLAGVALLLSRRRFTWVLAAWTVGYVVLVSQTTVHFDRNFTPVLGAVAVLGAIGAQAAYHAARASYRAEGWQRWAVPAAALALVAPATSLHVRAAVGQFHADVTDSVTSARNWLTHQIPEGAVVIVEPYAPYLDPVRYRLVVASGFASDSSAAQLATADFVVVTSDGTGRFLRDPRRYPQQAADAHRLIASSCVPDRYEDQFGYWMELVDLRCSH